MSYGSEQQPVKKDRLSRANTWVAIIGGIIVILGFFGVANFSQLFGVDRGNSASSGGGSNNVAPGPITSTPSKQFTQPPAAEPTMLISPNPAQPFQRVQVAGEGFRPGANVTIRSSGGATVGFDQADQAGTIRIIFGPLDQSVCSIGQDQWTAYVSNQPVADVVVNFC